ncbi:MAG: hypothetical protein WBA25_06820 [Jannaschia sp.]
MMRATIPATTWALALAATAYLAACAPPPPPVSGSFGAGDPYAQSREVELRTGVPPTEAERLANDTRAALGQPAAGPVTATTGPDLDRDNPAISREQDFDAVSAQRGIEDDAERLRVARQQYRLIQPTELQRPADEGPNVIAYALERARPLGASGSFNRNPLASDRRSQSRCTGYRSVDVAQEAFLEAGGPDRDRLNLDPDGDGNACAWDPAAFTRLVRSQ